MARGFERALRGRAAGCIAIAHRGARAFAPENTLPAFDAAARLGCPMVELDVQSTRDGHVVVHHDDDLFRCTNAALVYPDRSPWRLADFSLAELQSLDASIGFTADLARPRPSRQAFLRSSTDAEIARFMLRLDGPSFVAGVVRVPRLSEVLSWAAAADIFVNVELKPTLEADRLLADRTLALIADAGMTERVLISSFDPAQLARMRTLSADVAIGLLTDASMPDVLSAMRAIDADALHPNVDDPRCLADLHLALAAGRMVFPWTCNDPAVMHTLAAAGATGVISDYPNRFAALG